MLLAVLLRVPVAPASAASPDGIDHAREYEACLALAAERPDEAYRSGLAWYEAGGGVASRHCVAVALVGLGAYEEAASRLETLALEIGPERPDLARGALAQAGQAWALAGRPERAIAVQSAALEMAPGDVELLVDRAVSLIDAGDPERALADLDEAIGLDPGHADAFLYRGTAKRLLDRLDGARADLDAALRISPDLPDALVERGYIAMLLGDLAGARGLFLAAIQAAPDSAIADVARDRLAEIDVGAR